MVAVADPYSNVRVPLYVPYDAFDIRVPWTQYVPHPPHDKQHAFLWMMCEEALFGGQAGGGKSDALLMAALQFVDVPGYAALILRKTYKDLSQPGAIMSRAKEWLKNTDAKWNENNKEFTFPSGAKLAFGYLQRDDDVYQYQSAEYQFIGFDELTQFTEFQYTYMHSRLRRLLGMRVPIRMRAATNPGGKGHQWVRRYFIKEGLKNGRVFIPSSLDDNPSLDRDAYRRSLEHLDPFTRAQLLHGDWTARPPGNWVFDHEHLDAVFDLGKQLTEQYKRGALEPPVDGRFFTGLDFGEASHVVLGHPREMHGMYIPLEHVYEHGEPDREARDFLKKYDRYVSRFDGDLTLDRSRFDASKPESMRLFYRTLREQRGDYFGRPSPIPFNKYKRQAILHTRGMASRTAWGESTGVLGISSEGCPVLEVQLYDLEFKGEDTEDLVKENDHGPDAVFGLLAPESKKWAPPKEKPKHVQEAEAARERERSDLATG